MVKIFRRLAVVIDHAEVERVDPLEIVSVEHVLRTSPWLVILPKVRLEQNQYRLEDRQARRTRRLTAGLKPVGQIGIDQRKKDDSWRILDLGNHSVQLGRRAHQRIDMFYRSNPLILRRGGAGRGDQRFSG